MAVAVTCMLPDLRGKRGDACTHLSHPFPVLPKALEEGEFPESVAPESLMSLDAELPSDISP